MFRKKKQQVLSYDAEKLRPALKSGICTGEKVAGFVEKSTGNFQDIMLVRNDADLEEFIRIYGIHEPLQKIY